MILMYIQEVSKAAADAEKELVTNEQAQVNLEERIKHANSKVKKLEKTLKEVRCQSLLVTRIIDFV